jgi:hypothetical protein
LRPIPFALQLLILTIISTSRSADAQLNFLIKEFEPDILRLTGKLREYIRGNNFPEVSHKRDEELHHIDLLFEKSMQLSGNHTNIALLAISLAVLNRTYIKPTFPIIGTIKLQLPAEDSSDAVLRINKLPRYFFNDSPQDKWGDSAKLVHFFGSAYLTYETGTTKIPDALGIWIEKGEAAFRLDSLGQQRDIFINRLGQQFGNALSEGRKVLPSDFLRAQILESQYKKIKY